MKASNEPELSIAIDAVFAQKIDLCERYVGCLQWMCQTFDTSIDISKFGVEEFVIAVNSNKAK